ncbi:Hypothetical protein CINCED_3A011910 [Cinara cedri]|uniref:Uncharacterized protein n=1 Tax=Cinara cedri TaxID=506608 RepID=A0A5E4MGX2_9HEMI|nr:Hypothetical protein CINCED_3A011910 [Cinara cedri]
MSPFLRDRRGCDGCLDTVIKSLLQVFNPNVEAGPGRIVSRHPYDDGIMPDYPAGQVAARNRMRADDDDGVPTADYVEDDGVDDRADAAPEKSAARPRGGARDSSAELAADGPGPVVGGIQPLTDFIVSLLETVQLTSRATLKKSRNKLQAAARAGAPVEPLARATTGPKADKF